MEDKKYITLKLTENELRTIQLALFDKAVLAKK